MSFRQRQEKEVAGLDVGLDGPMAEEDKFYLLPCYIDRGVTVPLGERIQVVKKYAMISPLIADAVAFENEINTIEVTAVATAKTLRRVIDFMNICRGTDLEIVHKPLRSRNMAEALGELDPTGLFATFINQFSDPGADLQDLYDLINAANALAINGLLHLGCAKVASLIKGEPLDQIQRILSPTGAAVARGSPRVPASARHTVEDDAIVAEQEEFEAREKLASQLGDTAYEQSIAQGITPRSARKVGEEVRLSAMQSLKKAVSNGAATSYRSPKLGGSPSRMGGSPRGSPRRSPREAAAAAAGAGSVRRRVVPTDD